MTMDNAIISKPKERVVFDADLYLGTKGEEYAVEDLMTRDGLTEEEVREQYSEEEIFDHAMEMRETDYEEEIDTLTGWFDGKTPGFTPAITDETSDWYGNPVIVAGSIGRWDGTRSGFTVYDSFGNAIDTSPSRYGGDNVFADCEIQKIWDENGHLFLTGAHHDGSVSVELRQLTNDGVEAYKSIKDAADAWTTEQFTINGRSYDGGDQSIRKAIHDLWDDPALTETPRYAERTFGLPAEEWTLNPLPLGQIDFEDEIVENETMLNFYIPIAFDADAVFGTNLASPENEDWLNVYANYDMEHGEVADHLDLSLNHGDGSVKYLTYPLNDIERDALYGKMDAYCRNQTGQPLKEYAKSLATERTGTVPGLAAASRESRAASQALDGTTHDVPAREITR